jgi:hypothetical protein
MITNTVRLGSASTYEICCARGDLRVLHGDDDAVVAEDVIVTHMFEAHIWGSGAAASNARKRLVRSGQKEVLAQIG